MLSVTPNVDQARFASRGGATAEMQTSSLHALDNLREQGESAEAIVGVAKQFEALFIQQMMKGARKSIPSEDRLIDGGMGEKIFTEMLDAEYAQKASNVGGIGLASMIARDLAEARGIELDPALLGASTTVNARRSIGAYRSMHRRAEPGFMTPVHTGRISSEYGMRKLAHEHNHRMHNGMDFAAPEGTPIHAAKGGTVSFAGRKGGYGNTVIIDHGDGTSTLYAHASALLVEAGDRVGRGKVVAEVGSTGRSTGPHLHFEVRRDGRAVDPRPLLGLGE